MTRRRSEWLACGLGLCLVGANVLIKPEPDRGLVRNASDSVRRSREWRSRIAPPFELPLLDGGLLRAQERIGHDVLVLVFFTTWCDACREDLTAMGQYADRGREDGQRLLVVGIDGQEPAAVVSAFVRDQTLTFPIGTDRSGKVTLAYAVRSFPTTVVIGSDGRVKLYHEGGLAHADMLLDDVVQPELQILASGAPK